MMKSTARYTMKVVGTFTKKFPVVAALFIFLLPAAAQADPGLNYCITPPFITAGIKPNLLLMIDNSASMYDLAYTDNTVYQYCANSPSTSCTTAGAACSGAAICQSSVSTTSTATTTPIACTSDDQCSQTMGTCPAGATCTWIANDNCKTSQGQNQCNKSTATVTVTTTNPIACTSDNQCAAATGTCPAGSTCTWGAGDTCNNKCTATTRSCLDSSYSNTGTYPGYFSPNAKYCYSSKSNNTICTYSGSYDEFDVSATMPATCSYGGSASATPYLCVNVDATGKVNQFVATGRFLNWLSTSKFDIEKSILTGGKFRTDYGNDILGESRGCAGRNFVKTIPGIDLTFGIRGGDAAINNTSQATQYGTTYIEIYQGAYDASDCTAAMNDWGNVTGTNMGPLQTDTKNCIGGTGNIADKLLAANQAVHDCFWYYNGHGLTNLQPIENLCVKVWANSPASSITSPNDPAAICSNQLSHSASLVDGNTEGYLGQCFTGGVWDEACALKENKDYCQMLGGSGAVTDPPSNTIVPQTVQNIPGFMIGLGLSNLPMINDYSAYTNGKKGFFLAVYDPTNFSPWPPTGLIQKYQNNIRFGAMTFQNNGSGTECNTSGYCSVTSANPGAACTSNANCSGGTCLFSVPCAKTCSNAPARQCYSSDDCTITDSNGNTVSTGSCNNLAKTDGGTILSYVGAGYCSGTTSVACTVDSDCASQTPAGQYCQPSIGNHTSGLLRTIDDVQATSWTPFAEAFYNAMGYFARSNDYTPGATPLSRSDAFPPQLPSPNTATSYLSNKNPSQYRCQSNNVLLITDGMSTADQNSGVESLATLYAGQVPYTIGGTTYNPADTGYDSSKNHGFDTTNKCPDFSGSRSISDLAWVAKNRNIKTLNTSGSASTTAPGAASESITTYVVYSGPQTSGKPGLCDPKTLMANTATNGGTTLFAATNPSDLYNQLDTALSAVASKAASGTAASILSNSEGSGANILQAVFYPKKIFDSSTTANWIGEMQNLWYYIDPYIQNSNIREDTDSNRKLNLINDYVVRFTFDGSSDKTMVQRYFDSNGDSVVTDSDKVGGLIDPDYVKSIWRAGAKLWARDDSTNPRTIYTGYNSTPDNTPQLFVNDGTFNATSGVWDDLQIPVGTNAQRQALATKLISYIRGTDQPNDNPLVSPFAPCLNGDCKYRGRKVTMGLCNNNALSRCTVATQATDCPGGTCTVSNLEWKLGDIISSTPRLQSTARLNTYDLPSPGGYSDSTYNSFINSNNYLSRGMVYVGANDGMLHAFKLGNLSVAASGFQKATLSGTDLGAEQWAFIPQNSLPYLKYTTDTTYNHLYYVDGRTVVFDASIGDTGTPTTCDRDHYDQCSKPRNGTIPTVDGSNNLNANNTWRTVVITGMGQGGASRDATDSCSPGATGNCVKTPIAGLGYSSYVALDVTDPVNPKFLWEFSNNLLGFATSAPAIVRIGDREKNGRWFAVFGNGSFGPIDTGTNQFKAESTHHLRFFVVDLRTGALAATLTCNGTGAPDINNAFAGTLLGGAIDADRRDPTTAGNYQDDAVYAGYVKLGADSKWTDGGVVRIMTKEDPDPTHWVVSQVIDGIGPVTTAIARTQDTKNRNLWLYFGTGRYFYRDAVSLDDNDNRRALFGLKEPCYNTDAKPGNALDGTCTTTLDSSTLVNQTDPTTITQTLSSSQKGWRIDLDEKTSTDGAERVVTDTVALTNGTVFFTSFKPNMDVCGYGGNSYLWGVKYDNGDAAPANALLGKALIQLSTGEFKEVDLSTAFTDKGNRRMMSPMTGKPPSDAPPIISNSQNKPVKKILHIQEH